MAEQDIDIAVRVTGAEQGADGMESLADSTKDAERAVGDMDRATREMAQRLGQLGGAISTVGRAVGSESVGMLGGLVSSTAQFASMGAALGPGGAVLGGLAGATAGLIGVAGAANRAREALADLNRETVSSMNSISHAIAGDDESAWSGAMAAAQAQIVTLEEQANELRATAGSTMVGLLDPMRAAGARIELGRVEDQIVALRGRMEELSEVAGAGLPSAGASGSGMMSFLTNDPILRRLAAENPGAPDAPRGGTRDDGGAADRARETAEAYDANVRAAADAENALHELRVAEDREREDARNAELDRIIEFQAEQTALVAEEAKERATAEIEAEQEKNDAIREMQTERLEKEQEAEERAREQAIAQQEEFMQLGMNAVGLMTDALGEIASGEKTADEAFKGLAKAFLQMISQYAALKAATEFADAIASFARYDFGGGAAHVAAGVAFTAVAVATGVGSAMINTSKPSAPARPEAEKSTGGKGGGDTIINWNSPVITASTRDDLGRELGAMVDAGRARYG